MPFWTLPTSAIANVARPPPAPNTTSFDACINVLTEGEAGGVRVRRSTQRDERGRVKRGGNCGPGLCEEVGRARTGPTQACTGLHRPFRGAFLFFMSAIRTLRAQLHGSMAPCTTPCAYAVSAANNYVYRAVTVLFTMCLRPGANMCCE